MATPSTPSAEEPERSLDKVLIVFYDSFTDDIPIAENSARELAWTNHHFRYDKGVIIRGRSHLIGKTLTLAWSQVSLNGGNEEPFCEVTGGGGVVNQYSVARVHVFKEPKRTIFISDPAIIKKLEEQLQAGNAQAMWTYGELEISVSPISDRIAR